jgi:hypothetical protein
MQLEISVADAATIPGGIESIQVRLHHVHTMVEAAGGVEFSASSAEGRTLNKIQKSYLQTQKNNLHSIPTDCPSETAALNFAHCSDLPAFAPVCVSATQGLWYALLCCARFGA